MAHNSIENVREIYEARRKEKKIHIDCCCNLARFQITRNQQIKVTSPGSMNLMNKLFGK